MKVIAVVVTYNAIRWIGKCLESLERSTFPVETIIVDNCSGDDTVAFVSDNYPGVQIISMESNEGFASAAAAGIASALARGAGAVLLMHHDVWVSPGTVSTLVASCSDDSLLVPVYYNGPGLRCETSFAKGAVRKSKSLRKSLSRGMCGKIKVRSVPPACWFLPSSLLYSVGLPNSMFPDKGESADYLARMRYHKKNAYVVTDAVVFHDRDSFGNRTLYDKRRIYSDLVQISCDPGKGRIRRIISRTNVFTKLLWSSMHYRVNLISVYRDDYRKIRKIRPLLRERRNVSKLPPVI